MKIEIKNIDKILVRDTELASLLSCSVQHIRNLDRDGKIPQPVYLGKSKRWCVAEIRNWSLAGCQERMEWNREKLLRNEIFETK